ncbi:MAG: DUF6171 family protein [Clostridiales bacterium]|nr:DUF6171 family protein [Clostridiales bacterium]
MPECRRCFTEELSREAFNNIREYVQSLDPDLRAPAHTCRLRLAACADCEWLAEGLCRHCGCFVEARAAKRAGTCPDMPSRWN